jgi:PAS domain S-box-containing protein
MPTMDGYELVRRLRESPGLSDTRVIFYTATYHETHARSLARECGALTVLTKPAEPQAILAAVEAALMIPRAAPATAALRTDFDREHAMVVSDKLATKVVELEATQHRLASLVETGRQLAAELDPLQLMQQVCASARQVTLASYAVLGITGEDGAVGAVLTAGLDGEGAARVRQLAIEDPARDAAVQQRLALRRSHGGSPSSRSTMPRGVVSSLDVPIATPKAVYGWLSLRNKLGAPEFSLADEQAATTLSAMAAVSYENARLLHDLQRSVEQTDLALEAARMGVFEMAFPSMKITWSETNAQLFGLQPGEAPADLNAFIGLVYPADREAFQGTLTPLWEGATEYSCEFRVQWPDGSLHWVAGQGRLSRDAGGQPVHLIGVGMDVTARKMHEEAIEQQRLRVLKATMRTVEDIVGNCFNSMQLLRFEAEGVVPEATLAIFDRVLAEGMERLRALGNLQSTPERQMVMGIGIDYEREE